MTLRSGTPSALAASKPYLAVGRTPLQYSQRSAARSRRACLEHRIPARSRCRRTADCEATCRWPARRAADRDGWSGPRAFACLSSCSFVKRPVASLRTRVAQAAHALDRGSGSYPPTAGRSGTRSAPGIPSVRDPRPPSCRRVSMGPTVVVELRARGQHAFHQLAGGRVIDPFCRQATRCQAIGEASATCGARPCGNGWPRESACLIRQSFIRFAGRRWLLQSASTRQRVDAQALALEVEPLTREPEQLRGLINVTVTERERPANHVPFEFVGCC